MHFVESSLKMRIIGFNVRRYIKLIKVSKQEDDVKTLKIVCDRKQFFFLLVYLYF